jgi:formate dehydrogenase subunit gamma
MYPYHIQGWAVRFALALAFLAAPAVSAWAQQAPAQTVPAQRGAADLPGAAEGQAAQLQRQATQPGNNAPVWRDVRSGEINPYQTTQVRGVETNILIQNEGEIWRRVRNGPLTVYGGWAIVLVLLALGLFYWRKGRIMLKEPRTGRLLIRFTPWERTVHWATAISFVILAVSGLVMLFGKYILLPVFGYTLFAWLAILLKNLHNFVGPLFIVLTVLVIATYVKDNVPQPGDWLWIKKFGGLISGEHVPSWRFNAAEKAWFWGGVTVLGAVMAVTGLILDFPNFDQGRNTMQLTQVIHAAAALVFVALSFGHIYLGTIGMEGAYDTMRHGVADEEWAREHHEYWYREQMAKRGEPAAPGGVAPTTAPAASMKDGWKL